MKKLFSGICALALTATLFTGCGCSNSAMDPTMMPTNATMAPTTHATTESTTQPTTAPTTAPTTPATVTKDVVIDLQGEAEEGDIYVSVSRDGEEVYSKTITKGTKSITLSGQTGKGTVVYSVVVNHSEGWETSVVF